jgi:hypothetical protein
VGFTVGITKGGEGIRAWEGHLKKNYFLKKTLDISIQLNYTLKVYRMKALSS